MSTLLLGVLACGSPSAAAGTPSRFAALFGYDAVRQDDIGVFPQWLDVLEAQLTTDLQNGDCASGTTFNRCHLAEWHRFLEGIRDAEPGEQLAAVNRFANERNYVLDIDNYGLEDYWAVPKLFLDNGGDCEDYVIVKLFSLRWLGWPTEAMRLVVVQDTNLQMPHAVLAVAEAREVWILDNLARRIVPERAIVHYAPVYSISDRQWWLHLPRG